MLMNWNTVHEPLILQAFQSVGVKSSINQAANRLPALTGGAGEREYQSSHRISLLFNV